MRPHYILIMTLVLLGAPRAGLAKKDKELKADHPFLSLLTTLSAERGREHRALVVHPITREKAQTPQGQRPLSSLEATKAEHLSAGEPGKNAGRGPLELFNWSTKPILLLGGEVFEGGSRDRFLTRDVLLGPGQKKIAPAHVADRKRRTKAETQKVLRPLDTLAPDLLRLVGTTSGPPSDVDSFLQDEYALAGETHPRQTLCHLLRAKRLTARMTEYRDIFAQIPDEGESRTVGVAALVGDRLVGVDLFDTNDEFRAHWPKILRTLAFQATLYEVSYGLLALPFPNAGKDPDRHKAEMKNFLKKFFGARAQEVKAVNLGNELLLTRDQFVGRALLFEDRVLHAFLSVDYLRLGIETAPPTGPPPEVTPGELERRAERGRLTEYERRLLERMRRRRQGPGRIQPPPRDQPPGGGTGQGGNSGG